MRLRLVLLVSAALLPLASASSAPPVSAAPKLRPLTADLLKLSTQHTMPKRSVEEMRGGDGFGETIESVKDYYGKVLRQLVLLLLIRYTPFPGCKHREMLI